MLLPRTFILTIIVILMFVIILPLKAEVLMGEDFNTPDYVYDKILSGQQGWNDVNGLPSLIIEKVDGKQVIRGKNPGEAGAKHEIPVQKQGIVCATLEWNMGAGQYAGTFLTLSGVNGGYIAAYVSGNSNGIRIYYSPVSGPATEQKTSGSGEEYGGVQPMAGQWITTQIEIDLDNRTAICRWKERSSKAWMVECMIEFKDELSVASVELFFTGNQRPYASNLSVVTKPGIKKDIIIKKEIIKPVISVRRLQDPSAACGAEIKIESPKKEALKIEFVGSVYDVFGQFLREKKETLDIDPNGTKVFLPVYPKDRIAMVHVQLSSKDASIDETLEEFIAIEPDSLGKVEGADYFGFSMFPYLPEEQENRMLNLLGACGCKSVRAFEMDRCYDDANKTIVPERMRRLTSRLREAGVTNLVSILAYSPEWASSIPASRPSRERRFVMPDLEVWTKLVRDYVKGSDFDAYEVWNEPDGGFWNSHPKADTYALLLKKTYEAVKDVRPNAIVVGGVSNNFTVGWPESILQRAPGCMDAISFHCYRYGNRYNEPEKGDSSFPSYISMVADLQKMSSKYNGGQPLPLWNTEFGYPVPDDINQRFDMHDQAKFMIRSFLVLAASGVEKSFNFLFKDTAEAGFGFGVTRIDWSIKPSWWAVRTLNQHAANKKIGAINHISGNLITALMSGTQNSTLALWSVEDYPSVVGLRKRAESVKSLYGMDVDTIEVDGCFIFAVPAGSVVYITSPDIRVEDIEPLLDLRPEAKEMVIGEMPNFTVQAYPGTKKRLGKVSDIYSLSKGPYYSLPYQKGYGQIDFSAGKKTLTIPVSFPIVKSISALIGYDVKGNPVLSIKNGTPKAETLEISVQASEQNSQFSILVPPKKEIQNPIGVICKDINTPEKVTVNVKHGSESWSLGKEIWSSLTACRVDDFATTKSEIFTKLHPVSLNVWEGTSTKPESAEDFAGAIAVCYDESYLYVLVQVTDDIHSQPFAGKDAWQGDSVQLAFCAPRMGDKAGSEILFYLTDDGREDWYCFDLNLKQEGLDFDLIRRDGKTLYFISVPLTTLRIPPLETARLSVIINENDGISTREGYLRWTDGIGSKKDSELYGVVQIDAKGK